MNRRHFLQGTAGMAALVVQPIRFGGQAKNEPKPLPTGVHVLSAPTENADQRLIEALSDDVFEQLRLRFKAAYPHGSLRLTDGQYVGDRGLTHAWHAAAKIDPRYACDRPPDFDRSDFRARTASWTGGSFLCYGSPSPEYATPITQMFDGMTRVGLAELPSGLLWSAHYVDEDTGLAMRAISVWDPMTDHFTCRWDVLCG